MKTRTLVMTAMVIGVSVGCSLLWAHCQIPCGIYDDQARFASMFEHVDTIEKSMKQINALAAEKPDWNQSVRWVNNKEAHADKLAERIALLRPYKITRRMMEATGERSAIFLHCLPAFHNAETELSRQIPDICEVEDEVFEGPQSRVFDEAENRLHTIKAVMVATLGG